MLELSLLVLLLQDPQPEPPKQEPPKQEKEVVVTASPLNPKDVFDTPYSADVVGRDDLERRLSRTTPDAMKEVPGVNVQKTSHGHGSPFIRGFTGFRNVFLVDGIRLNNSVFREGPNQYWNTVDPFVIDRLEIVRGPSSVLHGSDSIGGTVVAYTKGPESFDEGFHPHVRGYHRFASAEDSYTARAESWGNWGNLGWFAGATYRDFNDVTGGDHTGRMPETGYDEYDADLKFAYRLSGRFKLVFAAQHTRQDDVPRTHRLNVSKEWHGTVPGSDRQHKFDQERDLVYLQLHGDMKGGFIDAIKASLSWHRIGERFVRVTTTTSATSTRREIRELDVDTPALWVQAGKQTSFGYLTGGVEFYRDSVESAGHDWLVNGTLRTFARGDVAGDATYDLLGVYLQDEITIGAFDVTPGIRFTRAKVDANDVDAIPGDAIVFRDFEETYSAVTGSLRALWHVSERWNVIGGWGMGFRAPSLDDSTAIRLVQSSAALDVPSEDLDPEKSHTFDLGVRARYPAWEVSAFAFYTLLRDFIRRVPAFDYDGDGDIDNAKENFADGWVYGFELGGLYRLTDEILVFADAAWVRGRADLLVGGEKKDVPLDKVNPPTLHAGVRYQPKSVKAWIEALVTSAHAQEHLSPGDEGDTGRIPPGGTPGYTACTLRGGWQPYEFVTVTLSVENITNKDYRIHGSGQNEPGTNFIMGLDVRY